MQQAAGNDRTGLGSQRCRADGSRARLLARPVALYPALFFNSGILGAVRDELSELENMLFLRRKI
jgi:hypothetical protein